MKNVRGEAAISKFRQETILEIIYERYKEGISITKPQNMHALIIQAEESEYGKAPTLEQFTRSLTNRNLKRLKLLDLITLEVIEDGIEKRGHWKLTEKGIFYLKQNETYNLTLDSIGDVLSKEYNDALYLLDDDNIEYIPKIEILDNFDLKISTLVKNDILRNDLLKLKINSPDEFDRRIIMSSFLFLLALYIDIEALGAKTLELIGQHFIQEKWKQKENSLA